MQEQLKAGCEFFWSHGAIIALLGEEEKRSEKRGCEDIFGRRGAWPRLCRDLRRCAPTRREAAYGVIT